MTQEALADLAGVKYQSVQEWERADGTAPSRKRQEQVARALGVTVPELISGAEAPEFATNYGLQIKHDEAEAVKRLQTALPRWRAYVLGLAMVESHDTQQLLLETMTQTVSDRRVNKFVKVASHTPGKHELARVSERTAEYRIGKKKRLGRKS